MTQEPMPRSTPVSVDPAVEESVRDSLYGRRELDIDDILEQPPRPFIGALLLIAAFVLGGLSYAAMLKACS